jgi:hypothetical protein
MIKKILIYFLVLVIDLLLYLYLGFNLINYEDSYDGTNGEFYSLGSMNFTEKITFICLIIWYIINILIVFVIIRRIWKRIKTNIKI